jgi:hypothetical protein
MTPYRDGPPDETPIRQRKDRFAIAAILAASAAAIIPLNFFVFFATAHKTTTAFECFAILQMVLGIVAAGYAMAHVFRSRITLGDRLSGVFLALFSVGLALGGFFGRLLGLAVLTMNWGGSAWGRPLRVRGRQLHPELREGSDWTTGPRPSPDGLDANTRAALASLWLHDAQKEHASVPAFSRVSWLLSAAGSPPELIEGAHRAALEEADHARRCFALAAGYSGTTHTVEPMPELLIDGLSARGDVFELLAGESLADGCLLEDFNADVAAECAKACEEPVTREVLQRIAIEERSHAELSWAIVAWTLRARGSALHEYLRRRVTALESVSRPTAVSSALAPLVAKADARALGRHGRLPDERWAEIWTARLAATRARADELLTSQRVAVAA